MAFVVPVLLIIVPVQIAVLYPETVLPSVFGVGAHERLASF
jgi:hypothetical protein